jgi:transposase
MRSPGRPPVARREHRQRFWTAIALGLSSEDAAVACGVSQAVGTRWFRESGGMPPISLAPLSGRYLSFAEREEVAVLKARGCGVRQIARRVGRSPSTISRELRRNAATRGGLLEYRATTAQWHADRRARRPKVAKLAGNDALRQYVQDRLAGLITAPTARGCQVRMFAGSDAVTAAVRTGAGPSRGARSRSRAGCGSTSPMMRRCGSRTRRSTRPCTSKAAARCAVS